MVVWVDMVADAWVAVAV
jgi:hypothetical protein